MSNYKVVLSYDGASYFGFQRQTRTGNTVQGVIEKVLKELFNEKINIVCAGRTDAGVHALGQVINFRVNTKIPEGKLKLIINKKLPESIRFVNLKIVEEDFHSRGSALSRTYVYKFYRGNCNFPGIDRYFYKLDKPVDLVLMNEACKNLLGQRDCLSFMSSGSNAKSTVKNITRCEFVENGVKNKLWETENIYYNFYIEADSFLYNMIRIIASNLLKVGYSEMSIEKFKELIDCCDRNQAGKMLPPNGLYLHSIRY